MHAFRDGGGLQGRVAGLGAMLFGQPPRRAASTAIWLATSPEVEGVTGAYFQDRQELYCPFADVEHEEALYDLCGRMTGVVEPAPRATWERKTVA